MQPKLSLLVLSVVLTSCYHVYYAPNTANAPLLTEKGETRVNVLYSTGSDSEFNAAELQAACAVSKNIGVMANLFTGGKTGEVYNYSSDTYHKERGSGSYAELGGGYFHVFKNAKKWVTEVYGGAGFGSVKNEYAVNDHSRVGVLKFFLQPAFGYKARGFEFAIVPKLSYVNWKVKEKDIMSSENEEHLLALNYINQHKNFLVFEPALLIRAGGRDFKFQTGLSFSGQGHFPEERSLSESLNASLGISINIKPAKK